MKIAFLGDLAVFNTGMLKTEWKDNLRDVEKELSKYDLVVVNLEVPLTERRHTYVCKGMHLKSEKEVINILKYLHVSVVCLANNHICDFGLKGMEDTINMLEKNDVNYYGINNRTWNYDSVKQNIRFHGYCCYSTNGAKYLGKTKIRGVVPLEKLRVVKDLEQDKLDQRFSVLSFHWGDEYSQLPNEQQVSFAHELANKYNYILHGHHAHVMQGVENVNGSVLAYNQGNFCFDECVSPVNPKLVIKQNMTSEESFILGIELVDNKIVNWKTIGIFYDEEVVHIIENSDKVINLSNKIKSCKDVQYKNESLQMIKAQKQINLSKHDLKWLISKINYYSIGAKLLSYRNMRLYDKEFNSN